MSVRRGGQTSENAARGQFQQALQFSNRALENGDLCHRITGALQFSADLILQIGRIADAIDQKIEEPFSRKQALRFELFDGFIAHRHVRAAKVKHDIVVAALTDALKTEPFHHGTS